MASITQVRDNYRNISVAITGVLQASNSPTFRSFGYAVGSFTVQGTFQTTTAATVQLQGSNDGGTTWFSLLTAGIVNPPNTGPQTGSIIGQNNEVFQLYRFNVANGDAGTNLNFYVFLSATFG